MSTKLVNSEKVIDLKNEYILTNDVDVLETELFTIKENVVYGIAKANNGNWFPIMAHVTTGVGPTIDNSNFRLVEISPYDHIKIDNPCYFWDKDSDIKVRGHFAGVLNGKPLMWIRGTTSFSSRINTDPDAFCKESFTYCVPKDTFELSMTKSRVREK